MTKPIFLNNSNIRLFVGRLYNHDYLWFSSNEISKVSITIPVIHNYALSYALSSYSYGVYTGSTPRYFEDLPKMSLYATPAVAEVSSRTSITFNAINSLTLRTDDGPNVNTPDLGRRVYLDPVTAQTYAKPAPGFHFYVFTYDGFNPPGVVRLGKKGAAVRIVWQEIMDATAYYKESPVMPTHPVNPLDVSGNVFEYDPIAIPPHLLFRIARITNDWFVFFGSHIVLLPKLVRERCA